MCTSEVKLIKHYCGNITEDMDSLHALEITEDEIGGAIKHDCVLKESNKSMNQISPVSSGVAFCYGIRNAIFVLYAKTYFGQSETVISIFIYLRYIHALHVYTCCLI